MLKLHERVTDFIAQAGIESRKYRRASSALPEVATQPVRSRNFTDGDLVRLLERDPSASLSHRYRTAHVNVVPHDAFRAPLPSRESAAPTLMIATVGGARWTLAARRPGRFTMIVFYRGLHCLVRRAYLAELERTLDEFTRRGEETAQTFRLATRSRSVR
jgi:hypothetical protein